MELGPSLLDQVQPQRDQVIHLQVKEYCQELTPGNLWATEQVPSSLTISAYLGILTKQLLFALREPLQMPLMGKMAEIF